MTLSLSYLRLVRGRATVRQTASYACGDCAGWRCCSGLRPGQVAADFTAGARAAFLAQKDSQTCETLCNGKKEICHPLASSSCVGRWSQVWPKLSKPVCARRHTLVALITHLPYVHKGSAHCPTFSSSVRVCSIPRTCARGRRTSARGRALTPWEWASASTCARATSSRAQSSGLQTHGSGLTHMREWRALCLAATGRIRSRH